MNSGFEILRILSRETGQAEAFRTVPPLYDLINKNLPNHQAFVKEVSEKHGLGDIMDMESNLEAIRMESLQTLYQATLFHYLTEIDAISYNPVKEEDVDKTVDNLVKYAYGTNETGNDLTRLSASLVDWYRALNHPETLATLQQKGEITSQQALGLFNEYIQKNHTHDGLSDIYAEIVTAVRKAPEYAPQIKAFAKQSGRLWGPWFP